MSGLYFPGFLFSFLEGESGWRVWEWRSQPLGRETLHSSPVALCPLLLKISFCTQTLGVKERHFPKHSLQGKGHALVPSVLLGTDGEPESSTRRFLPRSSYIGKSHGHQAAHIAFTLKGALCIFKETQKKAPLNRHP